MKTRRRGNLGMALETHDAKHSADVDEALNTANSERKASSDSDNPQVPDGGSTSGSDTIDFRSRSDTIGSMSYFDFRGRSDTLGSALDIVADCLGPVDEANPGAVQILPKESKFSGMINMKNGHPPHQISTGSQPSSGGSTSGFLSTDFGQKQLAGGSSAGARADIFAAAHTPPAANGPASYEVSHFGKRMRAGVSYFAISGVEGCYCSVVSRTAGSLFGARRSHIFFHLPPERLQSISGRLRSASDLEDDGLIDRSQKSVIKDLIIAGDDVLQNALDKYEQGDKSALEAFIKSGRIQAHQTAHGESNIDILNDLDLDYLTVDEGFGSMVVDMGEESKMNMGEESTIHHTGAPGKGAQQQPYDGIGELDFNEDYVGTEEELKLPSTDHIAGRGRAQSSGSVHHGMSEGRWRANSLAGWGLLEDSTGQQQQGAFGNWMDNPGQPRNDIFAGGSGLVGANGSLYVVKNKNKESKAKSKKRERELKKMEKERLKREKKKEKDKEVRARRAKKEKKKEEKRRRSLSPKRGNKADLLRKDDKEEGKYDENGERIPVPSGTGRPRSLSDPNIQVRIDSEGLLCVDSPDGWTGAYSPDSRKMRIERFLAKRNHRVWTKKVKYDVRKNFADSRLRVKGRFVKKEDELLMRDLMSLT